MKISFIEFTCSQIEPYQLSHISNSIQYPNEEKNKIKQKNRFNSFSQMNIFVFFSFLVALYPSLLLLLLLMFIIYEYIYIYISIDVSFFSSPSHHLFVYVRSSSFFFLLVIIFRRCMSSIVCVYLSKSKQQITLTEFFHIICVQIFFSLYFCYCCCY